MQRQRGRVAEHTLWAILTVAGPKLPDNQVRPRRKRILRQTVDPPALPDPVAGAHVVRVDVIFEPSLTGLTGGEEAALGLR